MLNPSIPPPPLPPPPLPPSSSSTSSSTMLPYLPPGGPQKQPIFIGHLVNPLEHDPKHPKIMKEKIVEEIQFKGKIQFEGMHIVPNRITPPGYHFTGRTRPELHIRPFNLQIWGRVWNNDNHENENELSSSSSSSSSQSSIQLLLSITINGGVQWLPFPHPVNQWKVDYLMFKGDYEELSIILHGEIVEVQQEEEALPPPPYPAYFDNLYLIADALYPSPPPATAGGSGGQKDHHHHHHGHYDSSSRIYKPVRIELTSVMDILRMNREMEENKKMKKLLPEICTICADSWIWLSEAAQLVEEVFSHTPEGLPYASLENMHKDMQFVEKINSLLESCWETTRQCLSEDYQAANVSIDTEIASILCNSVQILASNYSRQVLSLSLLVQNGKEEVLSLKDLGKEVINYGLEIIKCYRLLLVNEITTSELLQGGAILHLFSFLYTNPRLPNQLLHELFLALYYASSSYPIFEQYFYTPLFPHINPYTPYQVVVYLLANLKAEHPLYIVSKSLLTLCSFNNLLYQLVEHHLPNANDRLRRISNTVIEKCTTGDVVNISAAYEGEEQDNTMMTMTTTTTTEKVIGADEKHLLLLDDCKEVLSLLSEISQFYEKLSLTWDNIKNNPLLKTMSEDSDIYNRLVLILCQSRFLDIVTYSFKLRSLAKEMYSSFPSKLSLPATLLPAIRRFEIAFCYFFQKVAIVNKLDILVNIWNNDQNNERKILSSLFDIFLNKDGIEVDLPSCSIFQTVRLLEVHTIRRKDDGCFSMDSMEEILLYFYCSGSINNLLSRMILLIKLIIDQATQSGHGIEDTKIMNEFLQCRYSLLILLGHVTTSDLVLNLLHYYIYDLVLLFNQSLQHIYTTIGDSAPMQVVCYFIILLIRQLVSVRLPWDGINSRGCSSHMRDKLVDAVYSIVPSYTSMTDVNFISHDIIDGMIKLQNYLQHVLNTTYNTTTTTNTATSTLTLQDLNILLSDKQCSLYIYRSTKMESLTKQQLDINNNTTSEIIDQLFNQYYHLYFTLTMVNKAFVLVHRGCSPILNEWKDLSSADFSSSFLSEGQVQASNQLIKTNLSHSGISLSVWNSVLTNVMDIQLHYLSILYRLVGQQESHHCKGSGLTNNYKYYNNNSNNLPLYFMEKFTCICMDSLITLHHENFLKDTLLLHSGNYSGKRSTMIDYLLSIMIDWVSHSLCGKLNKTNNEDLDKQHHQHEPLKIILTYSLWLYQNRSDSSNFSKQSLLKVLSLFMNGLSQKMTVMSKATIQGNISNQKVMIDFTLQDEKSCHSYCQHFTHYFQCETWDVKGVNLSSSVGVNWENVLVDACFSGHSHTTNSSIEIIKILLIHQPILGESILLEFIKRFAKMISSYNKSLNSGECSAISTILMIEVIHPIQRLIQSTIAASYFFIKHGFFYYVLELIKGILTSSIEVLIDDHVVILTISVNMLSLVIQQEELLQQEIELGGLTIENDQIDLVRKVLYTYQMQTSITMAELLPKLLKKYFATNNGFIQLCLYVVNLFFTNYNYKIFLDTINKTGEGFTFEFIVVKLWSVLEDAFQAMHEMQEVYKLATSSDITLSTDPLLAGKKIDLEKITVMLCSAHSNFSIVMHILRGMLDMGLWGYENGLLTANSMNKALRSYMADPKKALIKYQRLYTMWMTNVQINIDEKQDSSIYSNSYLMMNTNNRTLSKELIDIDLFDARHTLVTLGFKSIMEIITKYSMLISNNVQINKTKTIPPPPACDIQLKMENPLAILEGRLTKELEMKWLRHLSEQNQSYEYNNKEKEEIIRETLLQQVYSIDDYDTLLYQPLRVLSLPRVNDSRSPMEKKRKISDILTELLVKPSQPSATEPYQISADSFSASGSFNELGDLPSGTPANLSIPSASAAPAAVPPPPVPPSFSQPPPFPPTSHLSPPPPVPPLAATAVDNSYLQEIQGKVSNPEGGRRQRSRFQRDDSSSQVSSGSFTMGSNSLDRQQSNDSYYGPGDIPLNSGAGHFQNDNMQFSLGQQHDARFQQQQPPSDMRYSDFPGGGSQNNGSIYHNEFYQESASMSAMQRDGGGNNGANLGFANNSHQHAPFNGGSASSDPRRRR